MKLTFKQFLEESRKKDKKKGSNQYPTKGVRDVVDFDKERTDKAYRSANSLSAPANGVMGMGVGA